MFISFRKSPPSRLITPLPSRIQDIEEGIHFLHKSSSFNSLRGQLLCQHTHMQTSCHRMTQNLGSKTYTHLQHSRNVNMALCQPWCKTDGVHLINMIQVCNVFKASNRTINFNVMLH